MACHGCEQRRVVMRLMAEATMEWTKNPLGPNIHTILTRLRDEATVRGELDPAMPRERDGAGQRPVVVRLMAEAAKEWEANPTGPNVGAVLVRLRDEAIARGELDPINKGDTDGNLRQDT